LPVAGILRWPAGPIVGLLWPKTPAAGFEDAFLGAMRGRGSDVMTKRRLRHWVSFWVVGLIGAWGLLAVHGPFLSVASADVPATGNLSQARADLVLLNNDLRGAIKRMETHERKVGLARLRVGAVGLSRAMKQLEAARLAAARQLPPVFGFPYTLTFSEPDCIDRQVTLSREVLQELMQGRLKSARENANAYAFTFVLKHLQNARSCNDALNRALREVTSLPRVISNDLQAQSNEFASVIKRLERQERKRGLGHVRVDVVGLLRTMRQLEAGDLGTVEQFPSVFYLPYADSFNQLACIGGQVALSENVLQEFELGRIKSGHGNPSAYPFEFVLSHLGNAKACNQKLEARLRDAAPASPPTLPIYLNTKYSFAERAADLVERMTLAEKVAQLRTDAPAIPRLGVQQYTYWSEGQHGINLLGADTNPGSAGGGVHATSFPTNFAATMSWDPALIYSETGAISDEARGFLDKSLWNVGQNNLGPSASDYGSLTFWAPTVNMDRDPRWGRSDEAFGEDPFLVSRMAGAFVDGYQGETLDGQPQTPYLKVAATVKHFALNDVEQNRQAISSQTNDADLHDYYTAQFKSLIENSHVSGLMTSLNAIDGTPAMADTYTDNQVAQRTYGFQGYTTSDCALDNIYRNSPNGHDWAPPGWSTDSQDSNATWTNAASGVKVSGAAGAEAYALRAGTDLNCTGAQATLWNIDSAISAGILSQGVIDNALVRDFTTRMMTGEFDPPSQVSYTDINKSVIQSPAHEALAEQVAANSLVLLKNADVSGTATPLLPASASKLNRVVIVGDLANKVTLGGYSGAPSLQVSAVQGITAAVKAANPNATVMFDPASTSTTATAPAVLSAQTKAAIQGADLVIVFVGTDAAVASEGHDRSTLAMPGNYDSLIDQVAGLGNPRMALVIQSDGPVVIDNEQGKFPAVVFSGYNGESQGTALADVLFGRQDPSGHLDFTWYSNDSQLPDMSNYGLTPSATGGLGRTYIYFTGTPTFPFGYGLSYTQFRFSNLAVGPPSTSADGVVRIRFDVTNTGAQPGAAVAQLYVATPFSVPGVELPRERLEGFQKTPVLQPGQTQTVTLTVNVPDLAFWSQQAGKWVVYDGPYQFEVGYDSSNIAASQTVNVSGALTPQLKYVTVQPEDVVYKPGDTVNLAGKNRWIADDTNHALEQRNLSVTADNIVEAVNNDGSFVDLSDAHVAYNSSNPSVATVTSTGIMKAIAPGVATISVNVNGVSGAAVVVVKQPFTLSAPPIALPGSTFTVTTTLPNAGSASLTNVNLTLTTPSSWTVRAISPSSFATVPGGRTAQTTWNVTAPAGVNPASYQLTAQATFQSANGAVVASDTAQTSVPYQSLTTAFDNAGISDDTNPTAGDLDGGGLSYSAQAVAATGLAPGATVTHAGLSFTWPNVPPGTADNLTASGQTIPLSGSGATLGFLGTSDYGTASDIGTIVYTDGSTQPFNLSLPDWWANQPTPGGDILATMPYINTQTGQRQQKDSVYYASVPLQPGKTVRYVTLPNVSQQATQGQTAMHIFAIAIG